MRKYFKPIKGYQNRFSCTETLENATLMEITLLLMSPIPIGRHTKIKRDIHPFDTKHDAYWEKRTSGKWRDNSKRLTVQYILSNDQKDICLCCDKALTINPSLGGEFKLGNMDIIHDFCQKQWQETCCNKLKFRDRPPIEIL